jgi:hypothetical protein
MKLVGFIKRFDPERPESKELSEMFIKQNLDSDLRLSIIGYLSAGVFLFGWMSFLRDEDGTPIGNNDFFTDGVYIWPRYYIYLKKYDNLEIDEQFIVHVKTNSFIVPSVSKEELINLENLHIRTLHPKKNKLPKPSRLLFYRRNS